MEQSQMRPAGKLQEDSVRNWRRIPQEKREACLTEIQKRTPTDMLRQWQYEHELGMQIGSSDIFFHFGVGMQIRNALRSVLKDDELPGVKYDDGKEYKNWDDFYLGALVDLVEETKK